jgi:molybdopterin biosynthesis enzyme MoaB
MLGFHSHAATINTRRLRVTRAPMMIVAHAVQWSSTEAMAEYVYLHLYGSHTLKHFHRIHAHSRECHAVAIQGGVGMGARDEC